ncbi:uncharacterized protein [Venturia canescens]|uniref:uncharacterized protein n=1 Tax=Venturia canescens TaxID=32260 RepID=UPI001C9C712F|nr:uncharacterized protein LOC122409837 [Venturia canescens]XP_043273645.1 uncharacterized protein LOC122409837 [Venturia canescens]
MVFANNLRCQYHRIGIALLVWIQKISQLMATRYEIQLSEMRNIASSLSSQECWDFFNLLSHRRAIEKKRRESSCASLLATWLSDPAKTNSANSKSYGNVDLNLRKIGRKDLARWVLSKMSSNRKRRGIYSSEINRRIEESDRNGVRNGTGEKMLPIHSLRASTDSERAIENQQASPIFWKIFFSSIFILLLILILVCFYKFVFTKLRCVCRSFNKSEDREYMLPEQTYGTATYANLTRKRSCEKRNCQLVKNNGNEEGSSNRKNVELSDKFSTAGEAKDVLLESTIEKNRSLLRSSKSTKNCGPRELPSDSEKIQLVKPLLESRNSTENSTKLLSSFSKFCAERNNSLVKRKSDFLDRNERLDSQKSIENTLRMRKFKPTKRDVEVTKKVKSENVASLLPQKKKTMTEKRCTNSNNAVEKLTESKSPRWISCSCNSLRKSLGMNSPTSNHEKSNESPGRVGNSEKTCISPWSSLTELSETYDELGMLFSQHLKQQFKPCKRKYCTLKRNLKKNQVFSHDITKCRNRRKNIFGRKVIISWDRRPACMSGKICRQTYDEYEIMRATRQERDILARAIINRRKSFLDQPCLSPVP